MRQTGTFYFTLQLVCCVRAAEDDLRQAFSDGGLDRRSQGGLYSFLPGAEQFFTPDPTETSASLGGMVNCNASGAAASTMVRCGDISMD